MEERKSYSDQRRLRGSHHIRELVATVSVSHKDFIQPLFVDESISVRTPITTLSQVSSDTMTSVASQIESDLQKGISKFLLFPVPMHKSESNFDFQFVYKTIRSIKQKFGNDIWLAADTCLCAYTTHGHCGILNGLQNRVLNDETVAALSDYALQLAQAGADCIAPSDMMDGSVGAIRSKLDANGFDWVSILSYAAKFSSQFYGPFRDACRSAPSVNSVLKDRKTYQLSPLNTSDAIESALRNSRESADIIMVKPALPYLDILFALSKQINKPLAAYHVSGEYQSIELLAQQNIVDRASAHLEAWLALKRAGASVIISYAARHAKNWIDKMAN